MGPNFPLGLKIASQRLTNQRRMRPMKVEEIVGEASKLSEEEGAAITSRLLHGLETPRYWVGDEEVARRMCMTMGSIGPTRARCLDKLRRLVGD